MTNGLAAKFRLGLELAALVDPSENLETKALYALCCHRGASLSDIANLKAEDAGWPE